ncbi:hypothetical protein HPO96_37220 [Kribbella sandramycini]|uniref:Uncharacterized protein n=1 Tax=Kribbella sandramycini TaxID=60450 RepID=A0A7Y4P2Y8_9ACTN|nr:hypothetical protein [Kribbella sandramycini]MBB6564446.1 hypothetical protein [Kribbella sandramycini]NOL45902.1 hypothetical protein [Kribbella sandramycini]
MTTNSLRFLDRLRTLGFAIPDGARVERLHPTRREYMEGAWLWRVPLATAPDASPLWLGSPYPLTELSRERLAVSGHNPGRWLALTALPRETSHGPNFIVEGRRTSTRDERITA